MAEVQEGVQVLFEQFETSEASSGDSGNSSTQAGNKDFHQEMFPSYVPPHKRGHNVQQDKFVNFKNTTAGEKDKIEGVDNDKYQRLHLPVPFALPRDKLVKLKADFPGVYFSCRDNANHDHPFSHVVTMLGTRFMQRRMKPGSRILDVYGNPNACDKFNTSQLTATEPKFMKALVNRVGPTDFIREINKWGPFFDNDLGQERYYKGSLTSMIDSGEIGEYDVLHMTHTLYYIPFEELARALHAPGPKKRVAYALIHRHANRKGSINDGEQLYEKKWTNGIELLRQTNVATNSSYIHPCLSEVLFRQDKTWMPPCALDTREKAHIRGTQGLAWEMHIVNSETWIAEIVPYVEEENDGVQDYSAMWDDDEMLSSEDYLSTPEESVPEAILESPTGVVIPTADGKFVELEVPCRELFELLRARCSGKERTPKLLEDMITTANHLVNPSTLFGNKAAGMRCPPDKIYDVAVAAFTVDVPKETLITDGIACLKPVLNKHARNLRLGPKYKDLCLRDVMSLLRVSLQTARDVNRIANSKDIVEAGLSHAQGLL